MRINSPNNQKVKFLDKNGYDSDLIHARKYLNKNDTYTIEKTIVGSWRTTVFLKEVPDEPFNSVCFEEVEPILEGSNAEQDFIKEYMNRWI